MLTRITGLSGTITKGPIQVATVGAWTMARIDEGEHKGAFAFSAPLENVDTFWITRGPHDLRLILGKDPVVFLEVHLAVSGPHASGVIRAEQRKRHEQSDRPREHAP